MTEDADNGLNIGDVVERELKKYVFFDKDEKRWFTVLWAIGTHFLRYKDIRAFDAYPYIAFMSPESDSGKSTALEVTSLLSYNSPDKGSYTRASILDLIDEDREIMRTIPLDNIDPIFNGSRDNADLVTFFEIGYQRKGVVVRMDRFTHKRRSTPAYCAKAFSGLKVARIPEATLSRTDVINMRPKSYKETIDNNMKEDIDEENLKLVETLVREWSEDESVLEKCRAFTPSENDISFLNNRKRQVSKGILIIAKAISEEWYQRALKAIWFLTTEQKKDEDMGHRVLKACYYGSRRVTFQTT